MLSSSDTCNLFLFVGFIITKMFYIHLNNCRSITVDKKPKPSAEESSKTSLPVEPKEEFADKDDDVIEDDNVDTDKKVNEDVTMAVDEKPATE